MSKEKKVTRSFLFKVWANELSFLYRWLERKLTEVALYGFIKATNNIRWVVASGSNHLLREAYATTIFSFYIEELGPQGFYAGLTLDNSERSDHLHRDPGSTM
ncbi:hypothetical protein EVAR_46470_1 [Eumeta japonica]|uniref:Uncharacterized protein n=1 Tax=Eumeta variegata TaxID=151549 RepID=A0A4C1XFB7_EUMVA|nr:hypothetical protein EVAR_46470_1 [Eumeta japonica]